MKYAAVILVLFSTPAMADWQVHEWTGKSWEPARTPRGRETKINTERTACEIDLVNLAMFLPDGTRLQCRRIQRPELAPSR